MRLEISHKTDYRFGSPPQYGLQQVRLTPQSGSGQSIIDWALEFEGGTVQAEFSDQHGNIVHLVRLDEDCLRLSVESRGHVEIEDLAGIVGEHSGYAPLWLYRWETPLTLPQKGVRALLKSYVKREGDDIHWLHGLSAKIAETVRYEPGNTHVETTAEDALREGVGVCQDHAHIFISAAREAGLPARYVSGYLMMNDRVFQDATHAWAEAYVDGVGWTGFDVSNQISPDARYVRVATGLDYAEAAPISGLTIGGADESIQVDLRVQLQAQQ